MCSHRLPRVCGSSPVDGSSRNTSSGRGRGPSRFEPPPLAAGQGLGPAGPGRPDRAAEQLGRARATVGIPYSRPGCVSSSSTFAAGSIRPGLRCLGRSRCDGERRPDRAAGRGRRPRPRRRSGEQRRQHPQRRRLAGPVRTEQADHLAGGDVEIDAAHGLDGLPSAAERPGQALPPRSSPSLVPFLARRQRRRAGAVGPVQFLGEPPRRAASSSASIRAIARRATLGLRVVSSPRRIVGRLELGRCGPC